MSIKVGFIGCGYVSRTHLEILKSNPDVEMVSYSGSRNFGKAKDCAKRCGGTAYRNYREMIEKETLDVVYIMVPPFAHGEIELSCAQRGIHMFVEKPIALDIRTAEMIQESIEKNKIICSVGYQWRYSPITEKVIQLLKGREIGMIEGHWCAHFPKGSSWWGLKSKSGGQTLEQTTHLFDLARCLFGEVKRVYCENDLRLLKGIKDFDVEDVSVVTLRFKSGVIGTMVSTCVNTPRLMELKIIARDITLIHKGYKLQVYQDDRVETLDEESFFNAFAEGNKVFIEAVKTKTSNQIKSPYDDAMKTLALTLAVEESARKKVPVSL